ncbi:MAG: phospholipid carrier-dependent glycosyltransferase [Actinomycetota bacterium]|nr:phospholipid carrier-dependent glycosyltransferase [Actinomycetota bacterium]
MGVGQGPSEPARPSGSLQRLLPRPLTDHARSWVITLVLTMVAGTVRLWNLGLPTHHGTPMFDEKHYAPQAWQMLRNGGVEDNAGYELVVHPPLGKQLIALGELVMGYNSWGWRLSAALAGTVCVLLIVRIVRRLTRSTLLGAIAGVLLIADGLSHVQSRIGMLDIFLAMFVLAAFGCLVVDREQVHERLATVVREGRVADTDFGPRFGVRWWRFGAGVLLGLACGTKWSGVYYLIAFAVLSLTWDAFARRTAGVRRPWVGTLRRDVGPASWAMALVPIGAYLATWWAWFGSETAIDRHVVGNQVGAGGLFSFVPGALRGLWYYSAAVLRFHEGLITPAKPHPWESKPWSWPMGLRPMLYYYESGAAAPGCGRQDCVSAVMLVGTPALWWIGLPVLGWALWRAVSGPDWRYAAALTGHAAGWLPWFGNIDRQMYFFYMTPAAPFLVIAVTLVLGEILGRASDGAERRGTGLLVVSLYVGLVVANFVWLWPILTGGSITPEHWNAQLWLPSWR